MKKREIFFFHTRTSNEMSAGRLDSVFYTTESYDVNHIISTHNRTTNRVEYRICSSKYFVFCRRHAAMHSLRVWNDIMACK